MYSGSSGPDSSAGGRGHCVVFLGKTSVLLTPRSTASRATKSVASFPARAGNYVCSRRLPKSAAGGVTCNELVASCYRPQISPLACKKTFTHVDGEILFCKVNSQRERLCVALKYLTMNQKISR